MTLSIKGIRQGYGNSVVLDGIDLDVEKGEIMTVLGPNGSGKSTLIMTICNIMRPKTGTINIDGKNALELHGKEFSKLVGYVPQKYVTGDNLRVFEAVLLGRAPYMEWSYSEDDFEMAARAIELMGIEDLIDKNTTELSGGQMQKVVIARALAQDPEYYALDEPTSALDLKNQLSALSTMKKIVSSKDAGVIFALHDINLAFKYSDKVVLLKDGHVYSIGNPRDVINEENIMDVYGVHCEILSGSDGMHVNVFEDR